jgi:hypothetical protein
MPGIFRRIPDRQLKIVVNALPIAPGFGLVLRRFDAEFLKG